MSLSVAQQLATPFIAVKNQVTVWANGRHLNGPELIKSITDRAAVDKNITVNADGTFTIGGVNVEIGDDGELDMTLVLPNGAGELKVSLDDPNMNGTYRPYVDLDMKGVTPEQEAVFEREFEDLMDPNDMFGRKNNAFGGKGRGKHCSGIGGGGSDGGGIGGESNWFLALAEVLGQSLNDIADKLTTQTDKVKQLKNGGAPFKDSMRIQALAQQLSFMSQAFMTCLNSIGEAIKATVTAGGAAR
jgi:hypothetical protein